MQIGGCLLKTSGDRTMKITTSKITGTVGAGVICSTLLMATADATIFRCFTNPSSLSTMQYTKVGGNGSKAQGNYEIVSACSTTSGTLGSTSRSINRDGYYGSGTAYCWCRIVRPVAGVWVCTPVSSGSCASGCMAACANAVGNSDLRNKFLTLAS